MKKIKYLVLIAALASMLAFSVTAFAETDASTPAQPATALAATVEDADDDADDLVTPDFIAEVAAHFGIAGAEVEGLNIAGAEQGEVFFTCFFASETGKSTTEVAQLRVDGQGWGQMVRDNNLKPGAHGRAMGSFRSGK